MEAVEMVRVMFTKALLTIILTVSAYSAYSQYLFVKQSNSNYWFKGLFEDSLTKDLYITSTIYQNTPSYSNANSSIIKISKTGVQLDSIKLDSNLIVDNAPVKINNCYYLTASQITNHNPSNFKTIPVVYKYNLNFNLIKKIILDSNYNNDQGAIHTQVLYKNNRIFVGYTKYGAGGVKLYKLDTTLTKIDSLSFNGTSTSDIVNYGSNIAICGAAFPNSSAFGNDQLRILDQNFNYLNHFNLDSVTSVNPGCYQKIGLGLSHTNFFQISPNKYLLSGYYKVVFNNQCNSYMKNIIAIIKNTNQVVSSNIIGKPNANTMSTPPVTSAYKRFNYFFNTAMYGYNLSNPYPPQSLPTEIMVNKVDTAGNVIWVNYYSTPNYYYSPLGVYGTADSGVVVTGMRYNLASPAVSGACEGFVLKLDKNGVIQYTGINDKNITQESHVKVYPNPGSDNLNFTIYDSEEYMLELFNSLGQLLLRKSDVKETLTLSVKELEQGLYNYKLSSKSHIFTGKFVKE